MQKINQPLNLFPIDLLLLSIDNRQRVTSNHNKINMLQIEKNKKTIPSTRDQSRIVRMGFLKIYQGGIAEKAVLYRGYP